MLRDNACYATSHAHGRRLVLMLFKTLRRGGLYQKFHTFRFAECRSSWMPHGLGCGSSMYQHRLRLSWNVSRRMIVTTWLRHVVCQPRAIHSRPDGRGALARGCGEIACCCATSIRASHAEACWAAGSRVTACRIDAIASSRRPNFQQLRPREAQASASQGLRRTARLSCSAAWAV